MNMKSQCLGKFNNDVILLPDNVRYRAAHRAQDQLIAVCWQVLKNEA